MIRVLIADPDPATRKALAVLLERKLGITCLAEAGDIETLIEALADTPPDVLLLDWRLHGSPAPAMCGLLQRAYPHLQVVLLSLDADNAETAKTCGAQFVHKGASPDELINTLKPLLKEETA